MKIYIKVLYSIISERDLWEWLTGWSLWYSPTESPQSRNCSAYKIGWRSISSLVPESPRFPTELLVFSLCWDPKEVDSNTSGGMLQQWNRWTREKESKQAKDKSFLLPCPFVPAPTRRRGPDLALVFPHQLIQLRKSLTDVMASWVLGDSRWQPRLAVTYVQLEQVATADRWAHAPGNQLVSAAAVVCPS